MSRFFSNFEDILTYLMQRGALGFAVTKQSGGGAAGHATYRFDKGFLAFHLPELNES